MNTMDKKNLEKGLENTTLVAIIIVSLNGFVIIGSIVLGLLERYAVAVLIIIYALSIVNSIIIGNQVFKSLNIETINNLKDVPLRFQEIVNYWNYKDLAVDVRDYLPPKKHMIVFGVDFSITGGEYEGSDRARENLLNFLKQKNTKAIYICTPNISEDYPVIMENIKYFLQKVNFEEIKGKIEIYRRETNPIQARVILLDHTLILYQLGLYASDDFKSKIQKLAIKIDDQRAVNRLYSAIGQFRDDQNTEKIDLEKMWKELKT